MSLTRRGALGADAVREALEMQRVETLVLVWPLQDRLGELIHGEEEWQTLRVPSPIAKAGAWVEEKAEPIIPDDFDHGEKPFIRPFMIDMASDHYELDVKRAESQLDWHPTHKIYDELEPLIDNLKRDPVGWYRRNGITPPDWMTGAADKGHRPDAMLRRHSQHQQTEHRQNIWAHFLNMGLGVWLRRPTTELH